MSHDKDYAASGSELSLAVDSAIECMLWTGVNDQGESLDSTHDSADVHESVTASLREELRSFIAANSDDLDGMEYGQIGHDFILTRNRHGAGFWDRGLGERGDRLTDSAHAYGSFDAYVGDDGKVYGA